MRNLKFTFVDTHAHLYWDSFKEDFDQMIQRSLDAGVTAIINIGVDVEKSQEALDQVQNTKWPEGLSVYSTIGIHPHEAIKYTSDELLKQDMDKLEQIYLSDKTKVVGVGECGLDFFFREEDSHVDPQSGSPRNDGVGIVKNLQKKLFQAQIDLAKKLNLPLIVHCRDNRSKNPQNSECWNQVIDMTKGHFGIYHCYSGLEQTTKRVIEETSFLVAFAANITYPKNEYLREAVKVLPLDKILLETDSPFLAPQSKRGQRNEPSAVLEIAQLIAELKEISLEEVTSQTTQNAKRVFAF